MLKTIKYCWKKLNKTWIIERQLIYTDWKTYIVKVVILPKRIYRYMQSLSNSQLSFYRNGQIDPKIHMDMQGAQNSKTILQKNKTGDCTLSDSETYCKATVIITVWYWHRINIDQWNRIVSSGINPYIHGQLIFDKGPKTIQWG